MRFLAATVLALGLPGLAHAGADAEAERAEQELAAHASPIGTDFHLVDVRGHTRTLSDYRGKVVILYFGYTTCPDVCPTDLAEIAKAMRALKGKARDVQPLFITLDPKRDTAKVLEPYAAAFHPRLVALRGSEAETRRVASAFKVTYRFVPRPGGGYDIEHAAYTFILDREGRYRDYIPPGTPAGRTEQMLREALEGAILR